MSIELNDHQIKAMGTPCFASARIAHLLIAAGVYEDKVKKAEYEQAVFTHWALNLYEKHGAAWGEEGEKHLQECAEIVTGKN